MFLAVLGGMILLYRAFHQLGLYARRNWFGRQRELLIQEAFPEFCYQPFAEPQDIAGLPKCADLAIKFNSSLLSHLLTPQPEIYNLIIEHHGNIHRSVFDLRTVSRSVNGSRSTAYTSSVFLIDLPDHTLTTFSLGRQGIGNTVLWGENPEIDIEGEFIFSKNFSLTGPDRAAVTQLFGKTLVSYFRTNFQLFTNGRLDVAPSAILFYHAEKLGPQDIRATLDTLSKLVDLLATRN